MNRRVFAVLAVAAVLTACTDTKLAKPEEKAAPAPRMGTVGYVAEVRERGVNPKNWTDVLNGLVKNESSQNVVRVRYEVTVLYDDHTQGDVVVDDRPAYQPGQRVRVTGNLIEAVKR